MQGFAYRQPATLAEGIAALAETPGSMALAGGMSLVSAMKKGAARPSLVVNLKSIPGLAEMRLAEDGGTLILGALVRHHDIEMSPLIARHLPALQKLEETLAGVQIRNHGTIGGSLCAAETFSDPPTLLIALEAEIELHAAAGSRCVTVEDFILGPGQTLAASGEIATAVHIPLPGPRAAAAYLRLAARQGLARPLLGAAAKIVLAADGTIASLRLVMGSIAGAPQRQRRAEIVALGQLPNDALFAEIGRMVTATAEPIDDERCGSAYKKQVAGVLAGRAVAQACRDALGGEAEA